MEIKSVTFRSRALLAAVFMVAVMAVVGTAQAAGTDRWVSNSGADTSDCSVAASPCLTINYAIAQASNGDTIDVAAGSYPENVVVNKSLTIEGAFAGTAGFDASRDGTGEAVIHPVSGNSLQVRAADATVDGFAFDGATVNQHVVTTVAGSDNFQFVNNRITNVSGAAGITTSAGVAGWQIKHNLFENFSNVFSGSWKYGQALKFNSTAGGVIEDNTFLHVQSNAMQVELNTGPIQVINNRVDGVTPAYTNVGIQVDSSTEGSGGSSTGLPQRVLEPGQGHFKRLDRCELVDRRFQLLRWQSAQCCR